MKLSWLNTGTWQKLFAAAIASHFHIRAAEKLKFCKCTATPPPYSPFHPCALVNQPLPLNPQILNPPLHTVRSSFFPRAPICHYPPMPLTGWHSVRRKCTRKDFINIKNQFKGVGIFSYLLQLQFRFLRKNLQDAVEICVQIKLVCTLKEWNKEHLAGTRRYPK